MDAARLQRSFSAVAAHGDELPLYFYSHLFLTHPGTRPMFPPAMAGQRDRFVRALIEVVGRLTRCRRSSRTCSSWAVTTASTA